MRKPAFAGFFVFGRVELTIKNLVLTNLASRFWALASLFPDSRYLVYLYGLKSAHGF